MHDGCQKTTEKSKKTFLSNEINTFILNFLIIRLTTFTEHNSLSVAAQKSLTEVTQ